MNFVMLLSLKRDFFFSFGISQKKVVTLWEICFRALHMFWDFVNTRFF